MKVSLLPAVTDALVAGLRAYTGGPVTFRAPDARTDGVTVYDGPEWLGVSALDVDGFVVVGSYGAEDVTNPVRDQNSSSGSGSTSARAMAPTRPVQWADEIPLLIAYRSGSDDVSATRLAAHRIGDGVASYLSDNPTLGLTRATAGGEVLWVQVTDRPEMRQWLDSGAWCSLHLTLTISTRS